MNGNALEIKDLCKKYDKFSLDHINFTIPRGCVMGFIGQNGAGKSTTFKAILNLIRADSGSISVLGMDHIKDEQAIKQKIGVVLEDSVFPSFFRAIQVNQMLKYAYTDWNEEQFFNYLKRFKIDVKQPISEYSKGMRMKLCIASALSHGAELLLLDEPTSGLDPIVREEVLDIFWEFLQNENHSVLLSSHITSDLDKIADYITFINEGKILLSMPRDELLNIYGLVKCTADQLSELNPQAVAASHNNAFGAEALVRRELVPNEFQVETVNIEQIMLFLTRGEHV